MRIGVIGVGRIGALHAATLASLPEVDTLVVADAVPATAARVAAECGAVLADDAAALLAAGVDGVVVAADTDLHPRLVLDSVAAGVPVFCEKPVARDPGQALDVLRRVEQSGVPVQVGFNRRFDPAFVAARAAVASGELGWLHTVRSTTLDPAPPPPAYVAASGGIFRDCAIHDLDVVRWVTGREVVEVYATGSNRGDAVFVEAADVDTATAVLTLDDGTLGVVSNSRYNGRGYDVRLEVHGSQDSIAAGHDDRLPLRSVDPGAAAAGPPHRFFLDRFSAAYRAELIAFTQVVAGSPSPCTVRDAVETGWVAEACARSLREHRPVALEELRPAPGRQR